MKPWLKTRYEVLRREFKDRTFRSSDATRVLKAGPIGDSRQQVNIALSQLRKAGLVDAQPDPGDARKRLYRLKSEVEMISESFSQLSRGDLDALLKKAADLIRTRVDYAFILVLLFYKRISDKWDMQFEKAMADAKADGLSEREAEREAAVATYHDFDIPAEYLWEGIRKDPARIPEAFSKAMKILAERNPELRDVFENVDFVQFTTDRENAEILRQLVELFSSQSLRHVSPDLLGDAYEWILGYFAPQKAKEGEVYTPREVIKLLAHILSPKAGESVYDPALGSAGMLITSYQHLKDQNEKAAKERLFLFGQEVNRKTLALARMNLYIHDIRNVQLVAGDTLYYPKFKDGDSLKVFDVVMANPPWNQDGYPEESLKKGEFWRERFSWGYPTKQSADWAWIQHMLASTNPKKGRVGIVIDNGCLFRGGKEKSIRAGVVKADLLEAVVLLPAKLFYNTGAPGAVLFFNKRKPSARKGKVLFINASGEYEQHPHVRKLNRLGEAHRHKIANAFQTFQELEGFSRPVSIEELQKNDFNLNVTLYVFPEEEIEEIDISKEWKEIQRTEKELQEVEKKIEGYLKELDYV
ncbi:SAM-dependent DNA methyltransferase [candidate division TA06 bacterium]|uniref:site-specific DNA-methyltransferase (adenine-specific) n=1 Tax=candidate division TA06 bacterium TaxID=2250710 RepID=A0A523UVE4_UNCT6|nr:MAG: SAM-dependent DNA methyltransferase [candidate division TA06 bacterium]